MSRTDLDPASLANALRRMTGDGSMEWCYEPIQASVLLDVADLLAENAKLRELVRFIMHQCNDGNPRCDECIGWNGGECVALQRMRELGVVE